MNSGDSEIATIDDASCTATAGADLDFWHRSISNINLGRNNASASSFVDLDSLGSDDASLSEHHNQWLHLGYHRQTGKDCRLMQSGIHAAASRPNYDNENDDIDEEDDEERDHAIRQLRDLARLQKREMHRLAAELQESTQRRHELSQLLGRKDEELRKLRHELLLREIWCRQLAEETELESARSGRLLRRCQELQEQQQRQQRSQGGGACARCGYGGGGVVSGACSGFASRASSTRLGRFPSTTIWRTPPQQLLPPQVPQPPPLGTQQQQQQQARSAKKLSSLLTGRYSFRLRKRRSSSSAASSSAGTAVSAAASSAAAPAPLVRLESDV